MSLAAWNGFLLFVCFSAGAAPAINPAPNPFAGFVGRYDVLKARCSLDGKPYTEGCNADYLNVERTPLSKDPNSFFVVEALAGAPIRHPLAIYKLNSGAAQTTAWFESEGSGHGKWNYDYKDAKYTDRRSVEISITEEGLVATIQRDHRGRYKTAYVREYLIRKR